RRPAAHDLLTGIERRLREAVDQPVCARPYSDLLVAHAVLLRERRAQPPGAAVGVAVQLGDAAGERVERRRKGAERALVRGELDAALETELALHLLDRLARLVRNEALHGGPEEALCDARDGRGHGPDCSRLLFRRMAEIGLFPLELVLLPSERVPLHIFEDRYKELIGECLEQQREFGL